MSTLLPRRPVRRLTLMTALAATILGCESAPLGTEPDFKAGGGSTPLTATPGSLWLRVGPPTFTATVTAKVQYVGVITSESSDGNCATVAPASLPAAKPAGSSVYVAIFTVTPVGAGTCTVTLTDKRGLKTTVQVRVRAQRLVFASSRDGGSLELYDMLPDGTDQVRLTNNSARDDTPSVARDGSRIVFTSDRDGNNEIYVMNPDGSGQTRVSNNAADDRNPSISPDGTRIAFQSDRGGAFQIYTMAIDGTDVRQVATNEDRAAHPAWSPDGTRIAFDASTGTGNNHISVTGADGSNPTALSDDGGGGDAWPAWSPDGTRIVFGSNRHGIFTVNIYVMNANGSGISPLTADEELNEMPVFSLDGSRIAFASTKDHPEDNTTNAFEVYTINSSDGGDATRLTNNALTDWEPAY